MKILEVVANIMERSIFVMHTYYWTYSNLVFKYFVFINLKIELIIIIIATTIIISLNPNVLTTNKIM